MRLLLSIRLLAIGVLLVNTATASAQSTALYFQSVTPVDIPSSGAALPYPTTIEVSGVTGTIKEVGVIVHGLTHPHVDDLDILLVSPSGSSVMLVSDVSGIPADAHLLIGDDGPPAVSPLTTSILQPTNIGAADVFPAPAPAGPYGASLATFTGEDPNGTWRTYVVDDTAGVGGSISGFTLLIVPEFKKQELALVPPSGTTGTTDSLLRVRGLTTAVAHVRVSVHIIHAQPSDLSLSLIGPDGTAVLLAANVVTSGSGFGTFCDSPTTFSYDSSPPISSGTGAFVGEFAPAQSLSAFSGKSGDAANGVWTLRIVDSVGGNTGGLVCWSLDFSIQNPIPAPVGLTATSIVGNELSLWWQQMGVGPGVDGYVLEGGLQPGETLAQIPIDSRAQGVTLPVPSGAFYVRLRARLGTALGPPSNEIRIFVNTPAPPSPPKSLRATRNGTSVDLSWTNTHAGGAPTQLALDVTGSAVTTIPLPAGESVSIGGVPPGNYSVQLRALNASGSSAPSAAVAVAIPSGSCSSSPQTPVRFVASASGRTVHVRWEQPDLGGAATSYALIVTGAFVGTLSVTQQRVSATVGPGTYNIRVVALNQCGSSAATAAATVVVQ